jgi:hypothetical protein
MALQPRSEMQAIIRPDLCHITIKQAGERVQRQASGKSFKPRQNSVSKCAQQF